MDWIGFLIPATTPPSQDQKDDAKGQEKQLQWSMYEDSS